MAIKPHKPALRRPATLATALCVMLAACDNLPIIRGVNPPPIGEIPTGVVVDMRAARTAAWTPAHTANAQPVWPASAIPATVQPIPAERLASLTQRMDMSAVTRLLGPPHSSVGPEADGYAWQYVARDGDRAFIATLWLNSRGLWLASGRSRPVGQLASLPFGAAPLVAAGSAPAPAPVVAAAPVKAPETPVAAAPAPAEPPAIVVAPAPPVVTAPPPAVVAAQTLPAAPPVAQPAAPTPTPAPPAPPVQAAAVPAAPPVQAAPAPSAPVAAAAPAAPATRVIAAAPPSASAAVAAPAPAPIAAPAQATAPRPATPAPVPAVAAIPPAPVVAQAPTASPPAAKPAAVAAAPASAPAAKPAAPAAAAPAQVAAAPAAAPTPLPDPAPALRQAVDEWLTAWRKQDPDAYLAHYTPGHAAPGKTRDAWVRERRERLTKPGRINVSASEVQVLEARGSRAAVSFVQFYESDKYQEKSRKRLVFVQQDGNWRIEREENTPLPR